MFGIGLTVSYALENHRRIFADASSSPDGYMLDRLAAKLSVPRGGHSLMELSVVGRP